MTTLSSVLAVEVDSIRTGAVVAIAVIVVIGALAVKMFVNTVVRLVTVAVVVALAIAIWTQRDALSDCAERAKSVADVSSGDLARGSIACTFFGVTIDVPLPVSGS